jgi:hypothetical protein
MSDINEPVVLMRKIACRAPWYAAAGGLIGAIIGALIVYYFVHCNCK